MAESYVRKSLICSVEKIGLDFRLMVLDEKSKEFNDKSLKGKLNKSSFIRLIVDLSRLE